MNGTRTGQPQQFYSIISTNLALLFALWLSTNSAQAVIVPTGNVTPVYDGSDPWVVPGGVLTIGDTGVAFVTVDGGSDIESNFTVIGQQSGSDGSLAISGVGSTHTDVIMAVGSAGEGFLNIEQGGVVNTGGAAIGAGATGIGVANVKDTGSLWALEGLLVVGGSFNLLDSSIVMPGGSGELNVTNGGGVTVGDAATVSPLGGLVISDSGDFSGGGTMFVFADDTVVVQGATVLGQSAGEVGALTLDGLGAKYTNTGAFALGLDGTGTLDIKNGGKLEISSGDFVLGFNSGSDGTASISGSGSQIEMSGSVFVGNSGTGKLDILNGGDIIQTGDMILGTNTTGIGTLTIDGSDSDLSGSGDIVIGNRGNATLNLQNGGDIDKAGRVTIGSEIGSTGVANVSGSGTDWTGISTLAVGGFGNGELNITDNATVTTTDSMTIGDIAVSAASSGMGVLNIESGGVLNTTSAVLGDVVVNDGRPKGIANVTGSGSKWALSSGLIVGGVGEGEVTISDGGLVDAEGDSFIANGNGSTGSVLVTGVDSGNVASTWDIAGVLTVGNQGTGTLDIETGGRVNTQGVNVGNAGDGDGTITVKSSTLSITNDLNVGLFGKGTVNYEGPGAYAVQGATNLGLAANSEGTLTVDNASFTTLGGLNIGLRGTGTVNLQNGTALLMSNDGNTVLGESGGATGTLNIDGGTTQYANNQTTRVGESGTGVLNVTNGAMATTGSLSIGELAGSDGTATVNGVGSSVDVRTGLTVGFLGSGQIDVENGGQLTTSTSLALDVVLGSEAGSSGTVNVTGPGSLFEVNSRDFIVGSSGNGELNITNGGRVDSINATVGSSASGVGSVELMGNNSRWFVSEDLVVGGAGTGSISVQDGSALVVGDESGGFLLDEVRVSDSNASGNQGGVLTINAGSTLASDDGVIGDSPGNFGWVTVTGAGAEWTLDDILRVGNSGTGTLTISDGGEVTAGQAEFASGSSANGTVNVTGQDSALRITGALEVADDGVATLTVEDNATVTADRVLVGGESRGTVRVRSGARMEVDGLFRLGDGGLGTMTIASGGFVQVGGDFTVSAEEGFGSSDLTVRGPGSQLNVDSAFVIDGDDRVIVSIENGGRVDSGSGALGSLSSDADGTLTVRGTDSQWNIATNLDVGGSGIGVLNIETGGLVSVTGTSSIGDNGTVNLTGGRFEFGEMSTADYGEINGVTGALAGTVNGGEGILTGFNDIANITFSDLIGNFPNIAPAVDTSGVTFVVDRLSNSGVLFGNGVSQVDIVNNSDGTIEVITGERMRFTGDGTNNGQYDIFGGQLRFGGDVTNNKDIDIDDGQLIVGGNLDNEVGGTIQGRGFFDVDGLFTNKGVMEFSGGSTDIRGQFLNDAGGTILTTGGGTTTFLEAVEHNGDIETAEGAFTVFLGDYTGGGSFPGDGRVQFEGNINLGNSPGSVEFGGDVVVRETATTRIEIAGLGDGDFDQFRVAQDMFVDGALEVLLIDGFELSPNELFLIAEIQGEQSGQFLSLGEGDLVDNFGGLDLFITYAAGDGNDLALFTVPEPTSCVLIGLGLVFFAIQRIRHAE